MSRAMPGAALLLLVAVAAGAVERDPRLAEGKGYYVSYCASCHGASGRGDGPLVDDLRIAPADLTRIAVRNGGVFPDPMIAEIIDGRRRVRGHGPRDMPVWGTRIGTDMAAGQGTETAIRGQLLMLIEYLKSIQVEK